MGGVFWRLYRHDHNEIKTLGGGLGYGDGCTGLVSMKLRHEPIWLVVRDWMMIWTQGMVICYKEWQSEHNPVQPSFHSLPVTHTCKNVFILLFSTLFSHHRALPQTPTLQIRLYRIATHTVQLSYTYCLYALPFSLINTHLGWSLYHSPATPPPWKWTLWPTLFSHHMTLPLWLHLYIFF